MYISGLYKDSKDSNSKIKSFNKFDLDKITDEVEEMEKDMADNDVDFFFEQLFKNADDKTKMAMKKSFQESKGTVLSTDWKEVGAKEVKPYEDK